MEATRSVYQEKLEEAGLGQGPFMFSYQEAASLMDTSAFHSPVSRPAGFSSDFDWGYTSAQSSEHLLTLRLHFLLKLSMSGDLLSVLKGAFLLLRKVIKAVF